MRYTGLRAKIVRKIDGADNANSYDYTKGKLDELVTIIIDSGASLFVSAVGVPPKHVVDRLHKAGIYYMNMIGHPKHVTKCLALGADLICAQGGEGGGHTGDVPTTVLIPTVAAMCKGKKGGMGNEVQVVAAGGLFNGQSLAAAMTLGASAVWVGTRFVLSEVSRANSHSHPYHTLNTLSSRKPAHPKPTKKPSAPRASTTTSAPSSSRAVHSACVRTLTSRTGRRTARAKSRTSRPRA